MTKVLFDEMLGRVRQEDQGTHGQTINDAILYKDQAYLTDAQRVQALANVSNQSGDTITGKMAYKVLLPGASFASQVTEPNTIYEIKDVFDIGGTVDAPVTVNLPANCTLKFNGGVIKNCTITLDNTIIEGKEGLDSSVILTGTCDNAVLCTDVYKLDKTGAADCTNAMQSLVDVCKSTLLFSNGIYKCNRVEVDRDIVIDGNMSILKSDPLTVGYGSGKNVITISGCDNATVKNIHFEGAGTATVRNTTVKNESPLHFIDVKNVSVTGCKFSGHVAGKFNVDAGDCEYLFKATCLTCTGCNHVEVKECEFFDNSMGEWVWISPSEDGSYLSENSVCVFDRNYIHNYENDTERNNSPVNILATNITFSHNVIENYSYRGSAINAVGLNVFCKNNIVKNCHFRSFVDTCEWGQWRNDYVEMSGNVIELYNGCGCVINTKRAIIENNVINAECCINVYCTYVDEGSVVRPTPDDSTEAFGACESIIIRGNKLNADNCDTTWLNIDESVVHAGVEHAISIRSLKEIGKDVLIENNDITIHPIYGITQTNRQPINIRNLNGTIAILNNRCNNGILSVGSSVYCGFVVVDNSIDMNHDCIIIKNNTIIVDGNLTPAVNQTLAFSSYNDYVSRIKAIILDNNLYLNEGVSKEIRIINASSIIENLTITRTNFKYNTTYNSFSAVNIYTDFVLPFENLATPRLEETYTYGNSTAQCVYSADKRCLAKYYLSGQSGITPAESQTLVKGDLLRISNTTVYMLLSANCTFDSSITAPTDTIDNSVVEWYSAKWLVLTRARDLTICVHVGASLPNISATSYALAYNASTKVMSIVNANVAYDMKGWKALGFKGTSFPSTGGADEGYLFYRTDIKIWFSMYVDRSGGGAKICWQALGSGRGESSKRPTLTSLVGGGFTYFDTDLGKLILWNGTAWVNVDGTALE